MPMHSLYGVTVTIVTRPHPSGMSTRDSQRVSFGLGKHFTSPVKPRDKKKTQTLVVIPGREQKRRQLLEQLEKLRKPASPAKPNPHLPVEKSLVEGNSFLPLESPAVGNDDDPFEDDFQDDPFTLPFQSDSQVIGDDSDIGPGVKKPVPDASTHRLFKTWTELLPTLVDSYLGYVTRTASLPLRPVKTKKLQAACRSTCVGSSFNILCLFFDHFARIQVTACECQPLLELLVSNGLFPTTPFQPRTAVSTDLLDFYQALFEQSCDAVHALATALHKFYTRRGYYLNNAEGVAVLEPFRRGLGYAVQWYDCLKAHVDKRLATALQASERRIKLYKVQPGKQATEVVPETRDAFKSLGINAPSPSTCEYILQQRCPACFGGIKFGRPLHDGADIHVALDGNFHHRHQRSAGDVPYFYESQYLLSKEYVDEVGEHIEAARKGTQKDYQPVVPDEAIDECEGTYEAADERKQKTSMDHFDDTGVMALICRHDIPLFFTNIDTPGEQQKYAVALLKHLFSLIPENATVAAFYDVGCVLDRSLQKYNILSESIVQRLTLATTAMHAYGHQWSCQLGFNPRLREGLGLTDGEGVERLWSRLRKLIGVTRSSARTRRLWLLDRQMRSIGMDLREDLGSWLQRRLRRGVEFQEHKAREVLDDCGIPIQELREQWKNQRESQASLQAHAPARLKKELDVVLNLQSDLEVVDNVIQTAQKTIQASCPSAATVSAVKSLSGIHARLVERVESLYASLNVPERFPELRGVDFEFLRTLLLARDLKVSIRKRAVGSFFEWERLDQAVGGKSNALGTKLHQQTRKAIAKRKPALTSAIRKFNKYCEALEALHDPSWSIPVPQALPTDLASLRDGPELMQDVWIDPCKGSVPRWLEDSDVRNGIRAMLKVDRCLEERQRLGREADNLCSWFGSQLTAVEVALRTPEHEALVHSLLRYRKQLLQLPDRWANHLFSAVRLKSQAENAVRLAREMTGGRELTPPIRITETMPDEALETEPPGVEHTLEADEALVQDFILAEAGNAEPADDTATTLPLVHAKLTWAIPANLLKDMSFLEELRAVFPLRETASPQGNWIVHHQDGLSTVFEDRDIIRLASPTACLNDVCMNGVAALLHSLYCHRGNNDIAILSTFDLVRSRYNASDADLWRHTHRHMYWLKSIWLLPVHRPNHWALCIIDITNRKLLLFDSLAQDRPWKKDLKDIMVLIARMVILANRNNKTLHVIMEDWTAMPLVTAPVQYNDYDCGLWVLASIAAVLRGQHVTGLSEAHMPALRLQLHRLVTSLPSMPSA